MGWRPLNDNLVVKLEEDQWMDITKPELIEVPDEYLGRYKKRSQWGRIISWGNRCKQLHEVGERVYFKWQDKRPGWQEHGNDFRFVKEQELMAKDEDAGS